MKAKTVSGYIVVNYGVNRGSGRKIEHKNGKLRIRGDFDAAETHDRIKNKERSAQAALNLVRLRLQGKLEK